MNTVEMRKFNDNLNFVAVKIKSNTSYWKIKSMLADGNPHSDLSSATGFLCDSEKSLLLPGSGFAQI